MVNILIVDDHRAYRERLAELLNTLERVKKVEIAGSCAEALKKARRQRPDLIIAEANLADGSCIEMMNVVLAELPETRFIVLTGDESTGTLVEAFQNGARGYLIKDGKLEMLLAVLPELDQEEFIVSPRMAQTVITKYSRLKEAQGLPQDYEQITARERDVLMLVCNGSSNRDIADRLVISENTVRVHLQSIFKKLNINNRREARERCRVVFGADFFIERSPDGFNGFIPAEKNGKDEAQ